METLINAMREPVLKFIDQEEKTLHLTVGSGFEQGCLAKLIKDMDRGNQCDLFFLEQEPFNNADDYLDHLAERLESEYRDYLLWLDLQDEVDQVAAKKPTKKPRHRPENFPSGPKHPIAKAPNSERKSRPKPPHRRHDRPKSVVDPAPVDLTLLADGPKAKRASADLIEKRKATQPQSNKTDPTMRSKQKSKTGAALSAGLPPAEPSLRWQPELTPEQAEQRFNELLERHMPPEFHEAFENPTLPDIGPLLERLNPDKPPPPAIISDRTQPAWVRLQAIFDYGLCCLPNQEDHRFVFVLLPSKNEAPDAWQRLLEKTADCPTYHPQSALRLVAAYQPEVDQKHRTQEKENQQPVRALLETRDHVGCHYLDLSEESRYRAEEALINDPESPINERMATSITLAVRDGIAGRKELAMERFTTAEHFFREHQDPATAAFAAIGRGDIYLRNHEWDLAFETYQAALPMAIESANPIVLFHIGKNGGEAGFRTGRLPEAARYFSTAAHAAEVIDDKPAQIAAYERHGATCMKLAIWPAAADSYEKAAELCRETDTPEPVDRILRALKKIYTKQNRKQAWFAYRDQIQTLSKGA